MMFIYCMNKFCVIVMFQEEVTVSDLWPTNDYQEVPSNKEAEQAKTKSKKNKKSIEREEKPKKHKHSSSKSKTYSQTCYIKFNFI